MNWDVASPGDQSWFSWGIAPPKAPWIEQSYPKEGPRKSFRLVGVTSLSMATSTLSIHLHPKGSSWLLVPPHVLHTVGLLCSSTMTPQQNLH